MAVYPSVYRARVTQIRGRRVTALIPQVFGEAPVEITNFLGAIPVRLRMGWAFFQGGNPEFPVFATGGSLNISVTEPEPDDGGGGDVDVLRQRYYTWTNNTTESDPGHGKAKCNNSDPALATELYLSVYDQGGQAAVTVLDLKAGDEIVLYSSGDISQNNRYTLVTDIINLGYEWVTAQVIVSEDNGFDPKNNVDIVAAWFVTVSTGGGGTGTGADEVWIGPDTPPDAAAELWYDTDEASDTAVNYWNTAWGVVAKGTFPANPVALPASTDTTVGSMSGVTVAGRRYRASFFSNAWDGTGVTIAGYMALDVDGVQQSAGTWNNTTISYGEFRADWTFESLAAGAHSFRFHFSNQTSAVGRLYTDGGFLILEDRGPVTRAAVEPPSQVPPTTVASGNALGVVAKGSFVGGSAWPLPANSADLRITNYLSFTSVVGRRYRMVCQVRAIGATTGSGLNIVYHGSGFPTSSDMWINATAAYESIFVEGLFDGTGVADTYWVGASSVSAVGLWLDTMSSFYIEDVGPNSSPALPVPATPPSWIPLVLTSPWVAQGAAQAGPPSYRKIGDEVTLRGAVTGGGANTTIMTMPVGFRPAYFFETVSYQYVGAAVNWCHVYGYADGRIMAQGPGGATPGGVSLAYLRFSVTP